MTSIALTIAGSDSGGGAGIQADIKTFSALDTYAASVITAITAQNTRGVTAVEDISVATIVAQMDAVFSDLAVNAVKIGMVSRIETIAAIAERLRQQSQPVVLDPVMVATSGDRLLHEDAIETLRRELLPLAAIVTPNLPEAALLTGTPMATTEKEITRQAEAILKAGAKAVLIKGRRVRIICLRTAPCRRFPSHGWRRRMTTARGARSRRRSRLILPGVVSCGKRWGLRRSI